MNDLGDWTFNLAKLDDRQRALLKSLKKGEDGTTESPLARRFRRRGHYPCGQETRPRSRGEIGMVGKHRGGARGAGVFGSTPTALSD